MQKNITDHVNTQDVLATARWGEPDYMAQHYPYKEGSFWLGRNPHNPHQALGYEGEGHIFLAAGARSGKGRSIIINNLIKWPGSLVSIDPKGMNATITAVRRGQGNQHCEGMGQDVYVLDPMNCANVPDELRAHFNLLDALDPNSGDLSAQADIIADAVCVIPKGGDAAEWAEEGREFISIIIQWVVCSPYIQDKDRNLLTVRNLIMEGEHERSVELQKQGINVTSYQILLDDMKESTANSGRIARQARDWQQSVKDLNKYYESVRKSAIRHLKFLNTDGMENTVANTGVYPRTFKLSELRTSKKGISVFLCLPPHHANPYGRWQKAMVNLILAEMQKHFTKPDNGHPLLVSIDEFPTLGRMDTIIDNMNYIGESGVKLFLACQHIINLKEIYGDNFEQFIAGSKLQIWFAPGGKFTGEYLSHMLGETEIIKYQRNINKGQNTSATQGTMNQNSVAQTESTSHARGTNSSQAYNASHTDTWSNADTYSSANSTSNSDTWSKTNGWNKNWQRNNSNNWGKTEGKAAGRNYGPHILFEGFEHGTNYNNNSNNSRGGASGSGVGGGSSNSETLGGTSTSGRTDTIGNTNTYGGSDTQGRTDTFGKSETETFQTGTTNTHTTGTQDSRTQGESFSAGYTETFHKKPLLTVHEAEHFLKTVEDPKHDAFPGLALIKIQGELPFLVRKINYDQDKVFERCFNPHPSHPYVPYSQLPLLEYEYTEDYYIPISIPKKILEKNYLISPKHGLEQDQLVEKDNDLFTVDDYCRADVYFCLEYDVEIIHLFTLEHNTQTGEAMIVRHRQKFDEPAISAKIFKESFLADIFAKIWQPFIDCLDKEDKAELNRKQKLEEEAEAERQRKLREAEAERQRKLAEEAEAEYQRKLAEEAEAERQRKLREAEKNAEEEKKRLEIIEKRRREEWRSFLKEEHNLKYTKPVLYGFTTVLSFMYAGFFLWLGGVFFLIGTDIGSKIISGIPLFIGIQCTRVFLEEVLIYMRYPSLVKELDYKKEELTKKFGLNPFIDENGKTKRLFDDAPCPCGSKASFKYCHGKLS